MQSTNQIKRRIKTSRNISQITKAMEMVAASKMRRAQSVAQAGQPYADHLHKIMARLASRIDLTSHPLLMPNDPALPTLLVLMSSDRGLAGGLNTNLFVYVEKQVRSQHKQVEAIAIGKKAQEYVLKSGIKLLAGFVELGDRPDSEQFGPVTQLVTDNFANPVYSQVVVAYNRFVSTLEQQPTVAQLLPIPLPEAEETVAQEYLFEPDPNQVLDWLLPYYVENELYHFWLESVASEHSARMVAMKNAHESAVEIVNDLSLLYNRARQAKITNELLDAYSARVTLE